MNKDYIIIIIIFLVLIVLGIIIIGFYNRILFRKKKVEDKLNSIEKNLIERKDIIQRLNTLFSNSSFHEDNLMLELNDLYIKIDEKKDNTISLINHTDKLLVKALSLENLYPELTRNQEYISLKEMFKENQSKVMYAIETYDEELAEYNKYRNKPVINIINKLFKFPSYDRYVKDKNEI